MRIFLKKLFIIYKTFRLHKNTKEYVYVYNYEFSVFIETTTSNLRDIYIW